MSAHRSHEFLLLDIAEVSYTLPVSSQRYHRKDSTTLYTIRDLVIDEATDRVAVVYENPQGIRFVRLVSVFLETVSYSLESEWPRFIRVS